MGEGGKQIHRFTDANSLSVLFEQWEKNSFYIWGKCFAPGNCTKFIRSSTPFPQGIVQKTKRGGRLEALFYQFLTSLLTLGFEKIIDFRPYFWNVWARGRGAGEKREEVDGEEEREREWELWSLWRHQWVWDSKWSWNPANLGKFGSWEESKGGGSEREIKEKKEKKTLGTVALSISDVINDFLTWWNYRIGTC